MLRVFNREGFCGGADAQMGDVWLGDFGIYIFFLFFSSRNLFKLITIPS